jgi:hypothetical protein
VPTHVIGSIAFYFDTILREEAEKMGIKIGTTLKKPIFGLVEYHMKQHFSKKL